MLTATIICLVPQNHLNNYSSSVGFIFYPSFPHIQAVTQTYWILLKF